MSPTTGEKCRSGCNVDPATGWAFVPGCPVHDPAAAEPEPKVPCGLCGWDLREASRGGGLFLDGAVRHMRDFHNLGDAAALAEVGRSERG